MNRNTLTETAPVIAGSIGLTADTPGEHLAASDLEQGRLYLQQSRNYVAGAIIGLSDAQWRFKPAPDRWSIAEIVEHMVAVEELVLGPVREQLAAAPASAVERDYRQVDAIVMNQFPNRLNKFQAPEPIQPTGQFAPAGASGRLVKNHGRFIEYLESTPDLRRHMCESPPLKAITKGAFESMDGYQWVLAAAAHNQRHTKQILEVKADPNFPAR